MNGLQGYYSNEIFNLFYFYSSVSPKLISRFKEREENVKADIFHAYVALLKQTKTAILPQLGMLLNKMLHPKYTSKFVLLNFYSSFTK